MESKQYKMKIRVFLLTYVIGGALTLHIDEGCEAKSEWLLPYQWNDISFSAWTLPTDISPALTDIVEFEDRLYPLTYDVIEIHRNHTLFQRVRDGTRSEPEVHVLPFVIAEGWSDFALTVDTRYGLKYLPHDVSLPLNVSVQYKPSTVRLEGTDVTINCDSELRMWRTSMTASSMPLVDSATHQLSLFSKKEFLPTIELEGRDFSLGWNEGHLSTIPTEIQPLPPFQTHNLTIVCCKDVFTICTIEIGEERKVAEELRLSDIPKSVVVKGRPGDSFFVLLHKNGYFSPHTSEVSDHGASLTACGRWIAVGAVILFTLLAVVILLLLKERIWVCDGQRSCLSKDIEANKERQHNEDLTAAETSSLTDSGLHVETSSEHGSNNSGDENEYPR